MFNCEKLLNWLDEKGITQYRFARMSGIEQSTVSRIISGLIDPGARTIARICQATRLSPDELIILPGPLRKGGEEKEGSPCLCRRALVTAAGGRKKGGEPYGN
ncbi:MAG: helix-turn-helix transcriptional regulator [Candidatus Eremiobacteraeota bacterium]|nr:helix-turn-helix transcriptional regulator [Candidatus Eremiobacteraeota bacterium]